MARGKTPCYNCTERRAGCHAGCEKYLAWSESHQTARQKKYRMQEAERALSDFMIDSARKNRKRTSSAGERKKK